MGRPRVYSFWTKRDRKKKRDKHSVGEDNTL